MVVKIAEENISYRKIGDHATNTPSTIWFGNKVNGSYEIKDNIKYGYDKAGNIEKIYENGKLVIRYHYDALSRLVREDNKHLDKTYLFVYDSNGNIVNKREFSFTLKDSTLIEELESTDKTYIYNGDQLLSYNGQSCVYDAIGNPIVYKEKIATWTKGRQLTSYDGVSFTYDGWGRRTSKGDITFTYDVDGQLLKQSNGIEYIYDHTGIAGLTFGGAKYFYRKDAQGNVIALIDESGLIVARYIYDAWGNNKVTFDDGTETTDPNYIGVMNPIRYRSYYYDNETKLYYLKSRYYDPELGRFMTIDDISYLDPDTINGLNLYAYCGNNPVMHTDPYGTTEWWEWLLAVAAIAACVVGAAFTGGTSLIGAALIGAAIGGGISIVTQAVTVGELNWGQFALDMGVGFISGAVGASGISKLGSVIVGGFVGGASSILSDVVNGQEINWSQFAVSIAVGAVAGLVSGAGARNVNNFSKNLGKYSSWNKAMTSFYNVQSKIASGSYATAQGIKGALRFVNLALDKAFVTSFNIHIVKNISKMLVINGVGTGFNAFVNGVFGW